MTTHLTIRVPLATEPHESSWPDITRTAAEQIAAGWQPVGVVESWKTHSAYMVFEREDADAVQPPVSVPDVPGQA